MVAEKRGGRTPVTLPDVTDPPPPLLLLDVDGVLAPIPDDTRAAEFEIHDVIDHAGITHTIWLNPDHRRWIHELAEAYELVWATGWQHDAPRLLGPLLGIPPIPVIVLTVRPQLGMRLNKLPDVASYVGDRPVAWIDDQLTTAEASWAAGRNTRTLLICPDPTVGLLRSHVDELLRFASAAGW